MRLVHGTFSQTKEGLNIKCVKGGASPLLGFSYLFFLFSSLNTSSFVFLMLQIASFSTIPPMISATTTTTTAENTASYISSDVLISLIQKRDAMVRSALRRQQSNPSYKPLPDILTGTDSIYYNKYAHFLRKVIINIYLFFICRFHSSNNMRPFAH